MNSKNIPTISSVVFLFYFYIHLIYVDSFISPLDARGAAWNIR